MTQQNDTIALVGRIVIAMLFLTSRIGKLAAPAATQGYIAAMGMPAPVAASLASHSMSGFRNRVTTALNSTFLSRRVLRRLSSPIIFRLLQQYRPMTSLTATQQFVRSWRMGRLAYRLPTLTPIRRASGRF